MQAMQHSRCRVRECASACSVEHVWLRSEHGSISRPNCVHAAVCGGAVGFGKARDGHVPAAVMDTATATGLPDCSFWSISDICVCMACCIFCISIFASV